MHDDDKKVLEHHEYMKTIGCVVSLIGLLGGIVTLITYLFLYGGPDKLTPPEVTLTLAAELQPGQESETVTVEVLRRGGFNGLHERRVTSGTLELTKDKPKRQIELKLPGSGNINYKITGKTTLRVDGQVVTGDTRSDEQGLTVKGDTKLVYRRDTSGSSVTQAGADYQFTYRGYIQAAEDGGEGGNPFARLKLPEPPAVAAVTGKNDGDPGPATKTRSDPSKKYQWVVEGFLVPPQTEESVEIAVSGEGTQQTRRLTLRGTALVRATFELPEGTYQFRLTASTTLRLPTGRMQSYQGAGQGQFRLDRDLKVVYGRLIDPGVPNYRSYVQEAR